MNREEQYKTTDTYFQEHAHLKYKSGTFADCIIWNRTLVDEEKNHLWHQVY